MDSKWAVLKKLNIMRAHVVSAVTYSARVNGMPNDVLDKLRTMVRSATFNDAENTIVLWVLDPTILSSMPECTNHVWLRRVSCYTNDKRCKPCCETGFLEFSNP